MIGRTNVGGGGVGNAYAVIAVTYPAGSTCTCTNGTKTIKAKDTSGSYLFLIPSAGTWTVTATDGTDTANKSIDITRRYQSECVELSYILWLYKDGNEYPNLTGGWISKGLKCYENNSLVAPTLTRNADNLAVTSAGKDTNGSGGVVCIAKEIDLSDYNTLSIRLAGTRSSHCRITIIVFDSDLTIIGPAFSNAVAAYPFESKSWTEAETINLDDYKIDISGVSGAYAVGVGFYHGGTKSSSVTIYKAEVS